jgi:type IX secretion system PorP/SprF family membrane protein
MNKMLVRICSVFIFLFCTNAMESQDMHFSQYEEAPMMLNPALTSAFHSFRGSVNYKTQWKSVSVPYQTVGASFEMKLNSSAWKKENSGKVNVYHRSMDRMGAGLSFFSDRAGDGNLQLFQVHLSLASTIPLNAMNVLAIGSMTQNFCGPINSMETFKIRECHRAKITAAKIILLPSPLQE